MPILAMSSGTVTAIWGAAFIRLPNGQLKPLKVGDKVQGGQQVITEDDGLVQISPDRDATAVTPQAGEAERVITDLSQPDPLEAPAAGLQGGPGASLSDGLRVERISEGVTPLSFTYGTERVLPPPIFAVTAPQSEAAGAQPPSPPNTLPSVSIDDVRVNEGAGAATFTITLSEPSSQPVTISYVTQAAPASAGAGATAGRDYTAVTAGTVTIPAGQTSVKVSIPIANDQAYEGDEVFQVVLGDPVNATIGQGTGLGTIADDGAGATGPNQTVPDDDRPVVSVTGGPDATEGQASVFTVNLSHPSSTQSVVLELQPQAGSGLGATPGADTTGPLEYLNPLTQQWQALVDGRLTFAPGQTSLQVRVATVNDAAVEGAERLALSATVVSGVTANASASAQNTVLDNDFEARVFESGLAGRTDPAPAKVFGSLVLRDDAGLPTEARLIAPTEDVKATINQQSLVWKETAPNTLTAYAGTAADAPVVAVARLGADGSYSFDLQAAIYHPVTRNEVDLVFGLQPASGAGLTSSLTIHVVDDQPRHSGAYTTQASIQDTNLLLVIDTSSSMASASDVSGLSRLQATVRAAEQLLDSYDDVGNVAVRLVTFGSQAQAVGDTWMTVAQARQALAALQPAATDDARHDLALQTAQSAFATAGRIDGAQNVAYVLSDSNPTPQVLQSLGQIESDWVTFLKQNQVRSEAIGLVPGVHASLDGLAYDGIARSDLHAIGADTFAQLPGLLDSLAPMAISGNLVRDAGRGVAGGADGVPHLDSVTIDGQTYLYVDGQTDLTVTTQAGGMFHIDLVTSDFTYVPAVAAPSETIAFSVTDRDGDTASSSLTLRIDQGRTTVGTEGADVLTVTAGSGTLLGGGGGDFLTGGSGNDVLFGHEGNDTLVGGAGSDLLVGGAGNDRLTGGLGSDVFAWRLADIGNGAGTAVDTLTDFSTRTLASGGDVLDLRDLLQGENLINVTGNIADYLRVETFGSGSSAGTRIDVSSHGGFNTGTAHIDQQIVLEKANLIGLSAAGASQQQVILDLIAKGRLLVDVT